MTTSEQLAERTRQQRRLLEAAIERLFQGTPRIVPPGRVSKVALSKEAGVSLNHLNRYHSELAQGFSERLAAMERKANTPQTAREAQLIEQVTGLESQLKSLTNKLQTYRESALMWEQAFRVMARAVHVREAELASLQTLLRTAEHARTVLQQRLDELNPARRSQLSPFAQREHSHIRPVE